MLEKIKEYIEEELVLPDKESKKAVRVFIRTLRDADMITREEKLELLSYVNKCWLEAVSLADFGKKEV